MSWFKVRQGKKPIYDRTVNVPGHPLDARHANPSIEGSMANQFNKQIADLKKEAFSGNYNDLSNKPQSLPASDVYNWAKQPNKPSYTADEVGAAASSHNHTNYLTKATPTFNGQLTGGSDTSISVGNSNQVDTVENMATGSYNKIIENCYNSVACGYSNTIKGGASGGAAFGEGNIGLGARCLATGASNECHNDQFALGHWNDSALAATPHEWGTGTTGTAVVIGNGIIRGTRSNALRINYDGTFYSKGAYNTTGADYAEYFEWIDGNPDNEDRTGIFVTLQGDKIKPANEGDYILGVVSANPSVIGNSDEHWQGQFQKDEFNRYVIEEKTITVKRMEMKPLLDENECPILDEDENPIIKESEVEEEITVNGYVENEGYDKDKGYIQRSDRPEWDAVGMLGQLVCYDDGTCKVNGYCKCGKEGVATSAEAQEGNLQGPVYRVIARVSDNLIKVIVR